MYSIPFFPQELPPAVEIYVHQLADNSNHLIIHHFDAVSVVWDQYYNINTVDPNNGDNIINTFFPIRGNRTNSGGGGWHFIKSNEGGSSPQGYEYPVIGFGLYKVHCDDSNTCFYIDYRDDRLSILGNYNYDISLKYRSDINKYYWFAGIASDITQFTELVNGELISIWEIFNESYPINNLLENFWQNCLVLIPSQIGNHPKLVWGPHPTLTDVVGYRVYRKYGTATFDPIATTDFDEYYYNDTELTLDFIQGGTNAYYYVKAIVIHESESEATNTVVANIDGQSPEKLISSKNIIYDFQINNYPNPFNPSTTIEYSTPERSNVVIKVYDMLGREVKELVNEIKDEGTYQVKFNAESLSSGVYIYTITVSNGNSILFRESKQMVLMK
ncbi:MAG: T9SS type A sorting domain-containing protein [Ignavibacteriales bacterium]|nr:MAG: T9SS type A sorting domain-containing protein [Ignavibacteriales bacterium]